MHPDQLPHGQEGGGAANPNPNPTPTPDPNPDPNPHQVAARLWTSSLQRTELTAAHIAHPDLPVHELEDQAHNINDL